jgi:hypothetical protein
MQGGALRLQHGLCHDQGQAGSLHPQRHIPVQKVRLQGQDLQLTHGFNPVRSKKTTNIKTGFKVRI